MFFSRSNKNNGKVNCITSSKLVITVQQPTRSLFYVKITLFFIVCVFGLYVVLDQIYDFRSVINDLCLPLENANLTTIAALEDELGKFRILYQIELSTRTQLEQEVGSLSAQLKEMQIELDFLRGKKR